MDFSRIPPLAGRLAILALATLGAQLAWRAGYMANVAVCLGVAAWAVARIVSDAMDRRDQLSETEARSWSALLERETEARRLTAFLDHAPVPLLAMRARGALSAINLSARRMFATDDVLADPPAALVAAVLGAVPGVRQSLVLDLNVSPDAAPRSYALTVAEVASDGDFVRIAALVDVQAEIQAAEAAALRELMQVLSHEIMNSLTPVTSLAQSTAALIREIETGDLAALPQAREAVEGMARRSEGLLRFVAAYRALARLPEPRLAPVEIRELVDDLALLFRSRWSPGVTLTTEVEPTGPAMLDRDLIFHALLNILTNAAQADRPAGRASTVTLTARRRDDGRLAFAVADNGAGIAVPDPQTVLRPFFTTKPEGAGIGLSIARQAAAGHGGDLRVATGPEGAVFTLEI